VGNVRLATFTLLALVSLFSYDIGFFNNRKVGFRVIGLGYPEKLVYLSTVRTGTTEDSA
jgi:hypothetical protein